MASWLVIIERILNTLKYCNKCCNKTKEDENASEQGYGSDEKTGPEAREFKTKNIKKSTGHSGFGESSATNQNTINPTFNINVSTGFVSTPTEQGSTDIKQPSTTTASLSEDPLDSKSLIRWVPSNYEKVIELKKEAVVGGYDICGSDLWIIRTVFESELIPAKLNFHTRQAYVAYENSEYLIHVFEVCCAPADRIKWIECSNGNVPPNAVVGGRTKSGEKLFIGRALQATSLCPGHIQPSAGVLYVPYGFKAHAHQIYEVMCIE